MKLIQVNDSNLEFLGQVKALYLEAFPKEEQKPYPIMEQKQREGKMQIWAIVQEVNCGAEINQKENNRDVLEFCGLAIVILAQEMVLLDYFAIDPKKRGKGIGSAVLELLKEKYVNACLILEIESTSERETGLSKEEQQIREKRKRFYYQNKMKNTGLLVKLFGVSMEVLSDGRKISFEEYLKIYTDTFGECIAEKIECISR